MTGKSFKRNRRFARIAFAFVALLSGYLFEARLWVPLIISSVVIGTCSPNWEASEQISYVETET